MKKVFIFLIPIICGGFLFSLNLFSKVNIYFFITEIKNTENVNYTFIPSFRIFKPLVRKGFFTDEFDYGNKQPDGWDRIKEKIQVVDNYAFIIKAENINNEIYL